MVQRWRQSASGQYAKAAAERLKNFNRVPEGSRLMPRMLRCSIGDDRPEPGRAAGVAGLSIADAAMRGDRADVLAMIKQGADVNAPQGDGVTALHWAARHGDAELVTALVAAGATRARRRSFGSYTPLHLAAERGSAPIAKALLEAGAPVDARTNTGATPLMFAAAAGDIAAITTLLDKGAAVNAQESDRLQTPLIFAAATGRLDAVKLLIARGADPNAATKLTDLAALEPQRRKPRRPKPRREARNETAAARRRVRSSRASTASIWSTSRWRGRAA